MFYNSFLRICEKQQIKPTPLLSSLGLSKGSLNNWKNGTIPNGDVLSKLADALNCTVDDLLGRETEKKNAALPDESDNAAREERIYNLLEDLLVRAGVMQPGSDITPAQLEILVSVSRILFAAFSKEEG